MVSGGVEELKIDIKMLKAEAYDVLAQIENINKQYKSMHGQLQQRLTDINGQIVDKTKQIDAIAATSTGAAVETSSPAVAENKELLQE
jgi:hypothetical protein